MVRRASVCHCVFQQILPNGLLSLFVPAGAPDEIQGRRRRDPGVPVPLVVPFRIPGLRQAVPVMGPLLLMLITVTIILVGWWLLVDQD